jgi:hypothetical protein
MAQAKRNQFDNLVDAFQAFVDAYMWYSGATDTVDKFHAEERLGYIKVELAQRLMSAVGQDKSRKNAPSEELEKQREVTDGTN